MSLGELVPVSRRETVKVSKHNEKIPEQECICQKKKKQKCKYCLRETYVDLSNIDFKKEFVRNESRNERQSIILSRAEVF